MSLPRRIFYNTLAQSLGKLFAAFLGLVTVAMLTRHLQENGFGQYSTVVAFLGLLAVLSDLGLYLIVVREISKAGTDHSKIISNALGLRLTGSLLALVFGALVALVFPYEPLVKTTMFVGIAAFVFSSLNQVLIGIFQKHLVQHLSVIAETIGRAVNLGLVFLFITYNLSLPYFLAALIFGNGVIFFMSVTFARRYEKFSIAWDFAVWKKILIDSWPLVFAVILNLLYFKTDTVILSVFHSEDAVGVYSLPYKILEGLLAFPAMFVGLIMPLLSQTADTAWETFQKYLQGAFEALVLMAIPMIVIAQYYSRPIINLLKGPRTYHDSPALLQILILSAATIYIGTLFGYAVVAVNKQKTMILGYLLGAAVGLTSYFMLIPRYSYWGAAWGTFFTEVVVTCFAYLLVRKASGKDVSLRILLPAMPAMLALILFFQFVKINWFLEIVIGLCLYIILLVMTRAIPMGFIQDITRYRQSHNS
ncbi:flippase [bacterium]|nr:MAG: flippase [bacterium]